MPAPESVFAEISRCASDCTATRQKRRLTPPYKKGWTPTGPIGLVWLYFAGGDAPNTDPEKHNMTRQRPDEWRKQQIRAAATRCFVRRGFAATRLLDIAREAGLSKGGVYFHYAAKDALFRDILDNQVRNLERRWSFDPVSDKPADRTLYRLVVAHLRTLEDEPEETRLHHLVLGMAPQDASFRETLDESFRVMRVLYAGVIERGISSGVFRDLEPDRAADCVLAMVQGLAAQSSVDPEGKLPMSPEEAAQTIMRMLCGVDAVANTVAAVQAENVTSAEPSLVS